jgi:ring-1,2-phenylacetyl-CoA epoxidase subunit PaaC
VTDTQSDVLAVLRQVAATAGLVLPPIGAASGSARLGRAGRHTEHLEPLLAELQGLARAHPEATW